MRPISARKPGGTMIIGTTEVADTIQCCHCNAHFIMERGSGKRRGWCMNCVAMHCGAQKCCECLPFEKRLDLYEQGKLKIL